MAGNNRTLIGYAVACTVVSATLGLPAAAQTDNPLRPTESMRQLEPTAAEMTFDGLVMRPAMFAETVLGTALFLITLPFSALGGNAEAARQRFIVEPAHTTFRSCLGCLPENLGTEGR